MIYVAQDYNFTLLKSCIKMFNICNESSVFI